MTRLYINGTQIDLYDDGIGIALTYSISDIQNIDGRKGAMSKTITVPLTPTNRRTLAYPDNISAASLDQNTVHTARVEVDGVDIFKGLAKIVSVNDEAPTHECEMVLVGDNGEWSVKTADLMLDELDMSAYDHVVNSSRIQGCWTNPSLYDYNYPVIDYGGLLNKTSVDITDLRPAIKARTLIKDIIEGQGYTISSAYLGGTYFGNVYFIGGTSGVLPASWRTNRLFRAGLTGNNDTSVASNATVPDATLVLSDTTTTGYYKDSLSGYSSAGYYVVDSASIQKFSLTASVIATGLTDIVVATFKIWRNRNGNNTCIGQGTCPVYVTSKTCTVTTPFVKVKPNDQIFCTVGYESFSPNGTATVTVQDTGTAFYNDVSLEFQPGNTVQLEETMPDITQLDFIQAMKQAFNLYFWTNQDTRTVYIEPRDDFFLDKTLAVDWSSKLDRDSAISIQHLTPESKTTRFLYKEDSKDMNADSFNKKFDPPFGGYKYQSSNKYIDGENDIENKVLAGTWMEFRTKLGLEYRLPVVARDNDKQVQEFEVVPRLLYYNGLADCGGWTFDGNIKTQYPHFTFVNFHQANDVSLSFANHDMTKGLFAKYYANTMYAQDNAKVLTGTFYLLPTDLLNIDFRKPVIVDGTYYTIQAIKDYLTVAGGLVEVELLKMVNKTVYTPYTPGTVKDVKPPEYDSAKPDEPNVVPLYVEDVRVKPSALLPLVMEDEFGNIVQLYTEG